MCIQNTTFLVLIAIFANTGAALVSEAVQACMSKDPEIV